MHLVSHKWKQAATPPLSPWAMGQDEASSLPCSVSGGYTTVSQQRIAVVTAPAPWR